MKVNQQRQAQKPVKPDVLLSVTASISDFGHRGVVKLQTMLEKWCSIQMKT